MCSYLTYELSPSDARTDQLIKRHEVKRNAGAMHLVWIKKTRYHSEPDGVDNLTAHIIATQNVLVTNFISL